MVLMSSANLPFLDSSDALDDRDSLQQRLDRDGYLFLKGFFERSLVLGLRRRLLEIASRHGFLTPLTRWSTA